MKRSKLVKLLSFVMVLAMLLSLCACGGSDTSATTATDSASSSAEAAATAAPASSDTAAADTTDTAAAEDYPEMTITIADYNTANSGPGMATQMAADYITEQSGGKITCDVYIGGTLMESSDTVSGLADGIADISYYMSGLVSGVQTVGEIFTQVFYTEFPGIEGNTEIMRESYEQIPELQEELESQGVHAVTVLATPGSYMAFADDTGMNINSVDDLNGKIIQASSAYLIRSYQDYGVSALAMGPADWYTNLERGVCDALVLNLPCYNDFGISEIIESYVTFGDNEGGLSSGAALYLASNDAWQSWPDNVKALVTEAFTQAADWCVSRDLETENTYKETVWTDENTHNIPTSEMGSFYDLAMNTIGYWKEAVNEKGYDADAIFNAYDAIVTSHAP